jgi:hypothetical protein
MWSFIATVSEILTISKIKKYAAPKFTVMVPFHLNTSSPVAELIVAHLLLYSLVKTSDNSGPKGTVTVNWKEVFG